jgi:hypothetical protein
MQCCKKGNESFKKNESNLHSKPYGRLEGNKMTNDFEKALAEMPNPFGNETVEDFRTAALKWFGVNYVTIINALQAAIAAQNVAGVEGLDHAIKEADIAHTQGMLEYDGKAKVHVNCLWVILKAARLHAQSRQAVAEGWKLVPVEPTNDMLKAVEAGTIQNASFSDAILRNEMYLNVYRKMLSAAPDVGEVW